MNRRRFLALVGGTGACAACSPMDLLAATRFSDELWKANVDIYDAILRHPFLVELQAGTLDRQSFAFYMMQDAHYLRAFGDALAAAAGKAPKPEWKALLQTHAGESLAEEKRLHGSVFREYGIAPEDVNRMEPAPEAFAYTSFLTATALGRPFHETLASLLPCYWIYWEVGKTLQQRGSKNAVYQKWIDNYASPAYGASVQAVLAIADEIAAGASAADRARMHEHYRRSSRYEWMFWDSAYHRRGWQPV